MGSPDVRIPTATLRGVEAVPVTVEVSVSGGIPGLSIVGMPDTSVLEARSRVRCAMKACGYKIPRLHVTVNLAPAEIRKTGTAFDLPIAVAVLAATGQIPHESLSKLLFVGELALDGSVCPPRGAVPIRGSRRAMRSSRLSAPTNEAAACALCGVWHFSHHG